MRTLLKPTLLNYDRAKAVDYYFELLKNKKIRFSSIRKEMLSERIPKEEVDLVVYLIDDKILQFEIAKVNKSKGLEMYISGWILLIVGTLITFFSLSSNSVFVVLAFGAIGYGINLIFKGRYHINNYKRIVAKK